VAGISLLLWRVHGNRKVGIIYTAIAVDLLVIILRSFI